MSLQSRVMLWNLGEPGELPCASQAPMASTGCERKGTQRRESPSFLPLQGSFACFLCVSFRASVVIKTAQPPWQFCSLSSESVATAQQSSGPRLCNLVSSFSPFPSPYPQSTPPSLIPSLPFSVSGTPKSSPASHKGTWMSYFREGERDSAD